MAKASIQGIERTIGKIFNEDYVFTIPSYQRPYAWTTEQASELLDDLMVYVNNGSRFEELTPYFLGSIVLIKGDTPEAKVVDGQQRLTTLTILLAVLRSLVSPDFKEELTPYLYEKGSKIALKSNRYRLKIRERDTDFFQEYIQNENGIEKLTTLEPGRLSDSQKNIRENALLFRERLKKQINETPLEAQDRQVRLAQFIINQCYLIVVSTPDDDSAYRIFSVLNDRGLNLSHADILKAEIIGKIPVPDEETYNEKWEDIEEALGRETFQSLFTYIRTIYRKVKSQDTILKEFREYVRPTDDPCNFIDNVLEPYASAFLEIKKTAYQSSRCAEIVNRNLGWLNRIENSDWIPPAILYLSRNHNDPDGLVRFFSDLERLAMSLMIQYANVNKRIDRYGKLLTTIENCDDLYANNSPLQLSDEEKREILVCLNGDLYGVGYCKLVLLRLDSLLSGGEAIYNFPTISIEHVLPQNPRSDSTWYRWFPTQEDREKYVHCLGNLVLLSQTKNSQAQRFDFDLKKRKYFSTAQGVVPFAITSQVVSQQEWTPSVIERRQEELIAVLRREWRLD